MALHIFRLSLSSIPAENFDKYELELVDSDLGSWEVGDKLVIASTDYNFEQAEVQRTNCLID